MSFSIINYNHQMAVHSQVKKYIPSIWIELCGEQLAFNLFLKSKEEKLISRVSSLVSGF